MPTKDYSAQVRPATLIIVGKKTDDVLIVYLKNSMTIGRESDKHTADILLKSPIVSRLHGEFTYFNGDFYYTDKHSRNGTYLNGVRIRQEPGKDSAAIKLTDGDILRIDRPTLNDPHPEAVTIIYSTSYDKKSTWEKKILDPFRSVVIGRGDGSGIADADEEQVAAVQKLWGEHKPGGPLVGIGSVKGNVGHCLLASAAASILKAALALRRKVLPPQMPAAHPLDSLANLCSPVYLLNDARPWITGDPSSPRRAAVMVEDLGGRRAALVLEEEPTTEDRQ